MHGQARQQHASSAIASQVSRAYGIRLSRLSFWKATVCRQRQRSSRFQTSGIAVCRLCGSSSSSTLYLHQPPMLKLVRFCSLTASKAPSLTQLRQLGAADDSSMQFTAYLSSSCRTARMDAWPTMATLGQREHAKDGSKPQRAIRRAAVNADPCTTLDGGGGATTQAGVAT